MSDPSREYCLSRNLQLQGELGFGKDGRVFASDKRSAVKLHEREESYSRERDVYIRLRDCGVTKAWIFNIPSLIDYDDTCRIIEMSIVFPPFLLDFASAYLDERPDFSEEVRNCGRETSRKVSVIDLVK